jgi:hypothetical protein
MLVWEKESIQAVPEVERKASGRKMKVHSVVH